MLDRKNPLLPARRVWSYSAQLLEPRIIELTEVDIVSEGQSEILNKAADGGTCSAVRWHGVGIVPA
jgi:hypothetical protein